MATGPEHFRAAVAELASGHAHLGRAHLAAVLRSLAEHLDPAAKPVEAKEQMNRSAMGMPTGATGVHTYGNDSWQSGIAEADQGLHELSMRLNPPKQDG